MWLLRHCVLCQRLQQRWCCLPCWQGISPFAAAGEPSWSVLLAPQRPCISYAPYTGDIQQLLYLIKYHGFRSLAKELGNELGLWYRQHWPLPDVVVPIPLHASRQQERGYNQSEVIARALARQLRRPLWLALQRERSTPRLYNLSPADRAEQLKNAFVLSSQGTNLTRYAGASLLIVDDILTSGSTLKSAMEALLPVSHRQVGLTLARADITDPLDL